MLMQVLSKLTNITQSKNEVIAIDQCRNILTLLQTSVPGFQ